MANKSPIRILLLVLPILTAFSIPAGSLSGTESSPAGLSVNPAVMIMQAFPNDFGDAPAIYGSADHVMDGRRYLGGEPDGEASQLYSDEASGDDLTGRDDEDGVTIPELRQGTKATLRISIVTQYPYVCYLNGWVDWNGDGDFRDSNERIARNIRRTSSVNYNLDIEVPADAIGSRPTFARFRLGPSTESPTGTGSYGEVEDYMIKIACNGPEPPRIGRITQPSCETATGGVVLEGLPGTGQWTLTRLPDGETLTGSGTTYTVDGLEPGTWSYTVTNQSGCTSVPSAQIGITTPPEIPAAPVISATVQPSCTVSTGTVSLSGLPTEGTWTVRLYPGTRSFSGSGTTLNADNIEAGTWYFTVTNASGCTSAPSANVVINEPPVVPSPPVPGAVTHPSCSSPTGTVQLSGLPSAGTWSVTGTPGNLVTTGSGSSALITGIPAGTFTFTVTNEEGCTSGPSQAVVINQGPLLPDTPVIGAITQPSCNISTGSVFISGLPAPGSWTLTRNPDGATYTGTGVSTTITGMQPGTYTFTVTGTSGCASLPSQQVIINIQPPTPTPPVPGTITQPTCDSPSGSVVITGLPAEGSWTLTRFPGSVTSSASGTTFTVTGLNPGSYNFTVTNAGGCTSAVSADVVINPQPGPFPTLVIHNPDPLCHPSTADITRPAVTAGSTPNLTYTYWRDVQTTQPLNNPASAPAGTYYIRGTIPGGCSSVSPVTVYILQPPVADAGPDQELTFVFTATLDAAEPDEFTTGIWTVVSGTGVVANPDRAKTTVSQLVRGENRLTWTVSNGVCPESADDLLITVSNIEVPSLITPDMNGLNDYFMLENIDLLGKVELTVFDRRGAFVYGNTDYNNMWHGTDYNGRSLPDDVYFYVIEAENGMAISGYLYIRN